jgi:ribosomal protein S18 acetylase RimI-like enzyme
MIRDLEWTDLDPFIETYWGLYEERARGDPIGITLFSERPSRSDEVAWFSNLYRRVLEGDTICVVAEQDGRAVGHCEIGPVPGSQAGSETYHVGELGILVDARYRGQGCGRALLGRALERARGRFDLVRLSVFSTNAGAKRLYERVGFTVTGRMPAAIRRGDAYIDLEVMHLDLRPGVPGSHAANR